MHVSGNVSTAQASEDGPNNPPEDCGELLRPSLTEKFF